MNVQPVLIDGQWQASSGEQTFQAINPATRETLNFVYPVSDWKEMQRALNAAQSAFRTVRSWPGERFAAFLEAYAEEIEAITEPLVAAAHEETSYPIKPRLQDGELPRTINQLRQAAAAARDGSWVNATIDKDLNIRSQLAAIGPVAVFGPNNFPLAFNSIAGGDFAAAVAAGNPVIAKGHSSHPRTTQLLGEAAQRAAERTQMPAGFVQLIYRTSHADGERLVADSRLGAVGYTGARQAGLVLKRAADAVGKPIYVELSSINPVFLLPGALKERMEAIADEFATSCLMGTGQFCTNPGLVIVKAGETAEAFIAAAAERFSKATPGTLLGEGVEQSLRAGIVAIQQAGAHVVVGNQPADAGRCCYANTLLRISGHAFLENPGSSQSEAFGNSSLVVVAETDAEMLAITEHLEGNLTGCFYTAADGSDDELYNTLEPSVRIRVGRLLNDKMPTGVAVTPAMNHGGPFPSTGHPGFTAVGIPAALTRFAMLQCYDSVRPERLPVSLQDKNPNGSMWRKINGNWTQADA